VKIPGNLTGDDTGILGSGTKGFTSTAVMRLVEQGKISLDDPAHKYIDISLKKGYNTTMYELFGLWANEVTVRHLIFMKSGIQDYEIGDFDQNLILPNISGQVHDPFEIL